MRSNFALLRTLLASGLSLLTSSHLSSTVTIFPSGVMPSYFALLYFFVGFSWWTLPGAILAGTGFFWTRAFIYITGYIALRKHGYKGKIKFITNSEVIRRIIS